MKFILIKLQSCDHGSYGGFLEGGGPRNRMRRENSEGGYSGITIILGYDETMQYPALILTDE